MLIALPLYPDPLAAKERLARLSLLHRLTFTQRPLARAVCGVMCQFRPLWRTLIPLVARRFPPPVARDGVMHTWRSFSGTLDHCIFGTTVEQVRELAAQLPVLFVHGDADDTAPIATVRELAADLPQASLITAPGAGHDFPYTSRRWWLVLSSASFSSPRALAPIPMPREIHQPDSQP